MHIPSTIHAHRHNPHQIPAPSDIFGAYPSQQLAKLVIFLCVFLQLYTKEFYTECMNKLNPGGILVTQCSSAGVKNHSMVFTPVHNTLKQVFPKVWNCPRAQVGSVLYEQMSIDSLALIGKRTYGNCAHTRLLACVRAWWWWGWGRASVSSCLHLSAVACCDYLIPRYLKKTIRIADTVRHHMRCIRQKHRENCATASKYRASGTIKFAPPFRPNLHLN